MPLVRQRLHVAGEDIHIALWPSVKEMQQIASRHYAFEGRCFVIAAGGIMRRGDLPRELEVAGDVTSDEGEFILNGGSCVIGPDGQYVAGPAFGSEVIILARVNLERIREVQSRKPADAKGFLAFIPWTFQDVDTLLTRIRGVHNLTTPDEYIRMIAISRIMLPNVKNIQASWLTVGKQTAQICLHAGANDFGSIMIEENVVSAAGAPHRFTYRTMQDAIREAGFEPQLRNQQYEWREIPTSIQEQVIDY